LTARADGKFEGTFTIPESADGQPYQYKFATNHDFNNPNFGLQGGSGNIVLRNPGGGATVTFVFDPVSNLGSDSINSVALSGDFQTQLGRPANHDRACPQSRLYDIDGDGVFTLSTGSITAGTYHVSTITGLGTGDTVGPTAFTVPTAGGGATMTISFASATHNLSTSVVPLVQPPPVAFGHPTARRGDVIANLWEWNWKSTARECTSVLGPAGYGAVQVAPPEKSINNPNCTAKYPPGGPGKPSPFAFQAEGDLLGLDFATSIKAASTSNITDLTVFGADAGFLPSRKSVPFFQNHNSERDGSMLN
jgi:hypothetical protein